MSDKEVLISNIDKIHTTKLGLERIKKNLEIDGNVVEFLKKRIIDKNSVFYKNGKNYYIIIDNIIITINSNNFCIITAHLC